MEASSLFARVGADTSQARSDLKATGVEFDALAAKALDSASKVEKLTERIDFQQRDLEILSKKIEEAKAKHGEQSTVVQSLQLRYDKLQASVSSNSNALEKETQTLNNTRNEMQRLQNSVDSASKSFNDLSSAKNVIQDIDSSSKSMGESFGAALLKNDIITTFVSGVVDMGKAIATTAFDSYTSNERLSQSFESLIAKEIKHEDSTKSMSQALAEAAPKAQALVEWNQQLAINSPFSEEGVAQAFKMAQSYGFVSETASKADVDAKRLTQALIDFSAGSGKTEADMNGIALALGQIQARGSLAGQEVIQLAQRGINVDEILSDAFGKSKAEIVDLRENGLIPADQAILAIVQSLENDYGGAAQRSAESMAGLQNSLQDLYNVSSRLVLGPVFEAAQPYIAEFTRSLQDPETKKALEDLGKDLGYLVTQALPPTVEYIKQVASGTKEFADNMVFLGEKAAPVIDTIRNGLGPIIDLYAKIQGLNPLNFDLGAINNGISAVTDLMGKNGEIINKNASDTQKAADANITFAKTQKDVATETGGVTFSLGLSADQLKTYQKNLDDTGVKAQDSFSKMSEAQKAFTSAEESRYSDYYKKTSDIQKQANEKRSQLDSDFSDKSTDIFDKYYSKEIKDQSDANDKLNNIARSFNEKALSDLESHNNSISSIQEKMNETKKSYNDNLLESEYQFQQSMSSIQDDYNTTRLENETKHNDDIASAREDLNSKTSDLNQKWLDDQKSIQDESLRIAQDYQDKLYDISVSAANDQADSEQDYQDKKADDLQKHNNKLQDLQKRLGEATTDEQKKSIQDQIDQENRDYEQQQAIADREYQQKVERAARDLQLEIDKQNREKSERDSANVQKLADQQAQYQNELQQAIEAESQKEELLTATYNAQQQKLQESIQAKQSALQEDFNHEKQLRDDKLANELDKLQESIDQENQAYDTKRQRAAQAYADDITDQRDAFEKKAIDAKIAYDKDQDELLKSFNKQKAESDKNYNDKLQAADAAYIDQEKKAQDAYDKQLDSIKLNLGEQLAEYTSIQQKMTQISAEEAQKRNALIAAEFGYSADASKSAFQANLQGIGLGGTVPSVNIGAAATSGAVLGVSSGAVGGNTYVSTQNIYITSSDPNAIIDEINRKQRYNANGVLIGG